ncbi:peptidase S10 [Caballeronia sp. ATUFL_M2_KS44]|uniref:S10 family peptidase n=1 Tax=Caballeronia sp. ATUFL_M2_KS44 TaxID=2921767 RepID=UPI0020282568|nr:peptidase S10 [Caballeronia sp. ATUFL_M2_KS44]
MTLHLNTSIYRWMLAGALALVCSVGTAPALAAPAAADASGPASGGAALSPGREDTTLRNRNATTSRAERAEPRSARAFNESDDKRGAKADTSIPIPPEVASRTRHTIRVDGKTIDYNATAGNLLLRDQSGRPTASVFYVAYTADTKDSAERPVTFLFNGGPGTGSIFLLMGSIGPKRVRTASPAVTPPAPYLLADNPDTLLDRSDLVFVDAVGTGLSRPVGRATNKDFWGVDKDLDAFDHFIERYLTVAGRWNSPKYLFGESYGTARAAMLAYRLNQDHIALNGVILMSSVLDSAAFSPGSDFENVSYLPTFAAVAWYHDRIAPKPPDLSAFLADVRNFARGPYSQALALGDTLPDSERDAIAARVAAYTGLDPQYVKETHLRVWPARFRKQLLRSESRTMGRFDARFEGIDFDDAGERPEYDPSASGISSAFDAAFHQHLAQDLEYKAEDRYRVFNDDALKQWDWKHRENWGEELQLPYAGGDLAAAMRRNPAMRVLALNGYFDLATPFYATEFALSHLSLDRALRENIQIKYYATGHMIYLDDAALHAVRSDLARFYDAGVLTK